MRYRKIALEQLVKSTIPEFENPYDRFKEISLERKDKERKFSIGREFFRAFENSIRGCKSSNHWSGPIPRSACFTKLFDDENLDANISLNAMFFRVTRGRADLLGVVVKDTKKDDKESLVNFESRGESGSVRIARLAREKTLNSSC